MAPKHDHEHEHKAPTLMGYAETYVKLAKHRILFISEDISNTMAAELSAMLLYFDNESHDELIEIYIHSNGGMTSGLSNIYDVMQMIKAPIKTVCIGKAYSAAAVILAAGTKGERYILKNASVMIHGVQCIFPIPGHDMTASKNYYEFMNEHNDSIIKMLAKHTGQSMKVLKEACREDVWLNALETCQIGLADWILE